jgi:hypothetical protein
MNGRVLSHFCFAGVCLLGSLRSLEADSAPKKERSPYAGTYTGTYTTLAPAGNQEGEVTLTVDDDGNVTGESKHDTATATATIKGKILKDNKAALVFTWDNTKANAYGTISKTSTGGVTGTVTQKIGTTVACTIEFELKPKAK